jgi:glycosyltransferase involved in cell wall biosynthesis
MTLRVFHVPSHLAYVGKLTGAGFAPVAAPTGTPLRISTLLSLASWDWFDVLHLHTVELASRDELYFVTARARTEGKRLVVTVHDLMPNIESDRVEFGAKLGLILGTADAVITLTDEARRQLAAAGLLRRACTVAAHGTAFPLDVLGSIAGPPGYGIAAYGALRPNRDLVGLLDAWKLLPTDGRPPLRILLRDVTAEDERRDATTLTTLRHAADRHADMGLHIKRGFVDAATLIAWLRQSHLLVLPYRSISHSGQLEAAIDAGLGVLAPDVVTLRGQVAAGPAPTWPVTWVPEGTLGNPESFAASLRAASDHAAVTEDDARAARTSRIAEHRSIVDYHATLYEVDT